MIAAIASPAWADLPMGFGVRDRNVLTAENLFGSLELNEKRGDDKETQSVTQHYMPIGGITQLGYHRVLDGQLTLGANVYATRTKRDEQDASTTLLLRPRVGYALPVSPAFGVWLRGGVLLAHQGREGSSAKAVSGGVDVLVVATPAPHFGVFGGILFEAPLWGRYSPKSGDSVKYELSSSGLTLGVLVDF